MTKEIKYKLQGNGSDSWEISEFEAEEMINRYMVYEKPEGWFDENDISEAKKFTKSKIDSKTQELIFAGFEFNGHTFSLSDNAQRNWIGIAAGIGMGIYSEQNFPFPISDVNDVKYDLQWSERFAFLGKVSYAIGYNKTVGTNLKQSVNDMTDINDVLNFVDPR